MHSLSVAHVIPSLAPRPLSFPHSPVVSSSTHSSCNFSHRRKKTGWLTSKYAFFDVCAVMKMGNHCSPASGSGSGYGHSHFDSYSLFSSSTANVIVLGLPFICFLLLSSTILYRVLLLFVQLTKRVRHKYNVSIWSYLSRSNGGPYTPTMESFFFICFVFSHAQIKCQMEKCKVISKCKIGFTQSKRADNRCTAR